MKKQSRYIHVENTHNLESPREIVPELVKLLNPKSVVDFGCGIGNFLYCFKESGIKQVLGVDGPWTNRELLHKYLAPGEFKEWNLEKKITLEKEFDLVISLETAEHLSEESADIFVENLISAGKIIVFSASVPYQEGQRHINEQWLSYWEEKFRARSYEMHDILRPIFWDNPNIFWWYKQNMVLFTAKESNFSTGYTYNVLKNVVHYDFFIQKAKRFDVIINGDASTKTYLSYLKKSFAKKMKLIFAKRNDH